MIHICMAVLVFGLFLAAPKGTLAKKIRSFALIIILTYCFYTLSPILGMAYLFFGSLSELLKEDLLQKEDRGFFAVKGKAFWPKAISSMVVLMGSLLAFAWIDKTRNSEFASGVSEQDLILYLLLFFGATSVLKGTRK